MNELPENRRTPAIAKGRPRAKSKYSFEEECGWLYEQLSGNGKVGRKAFNKRFELGDRLDKWSLASDALLGVLPKLDTPMPLKRGKDKDTGEDQLSLEEYQSGRYST